MFTFNFNFTTLIKYSIYFFIVLFIFSKEIVVINEEFLIILSFLAVFLGLQSALSSVLTTELNERNSQIKKQFLSLYVNKQNYQTILTTLLNNKINLLSNFKFYSNFLVTSLLTVVKNRNLIFLESVSIYTEQLLLTYILKYNLELKNLYFKKVNSLNYNLLIKE